MIQAHQQDPITSKEINVDQLLVSSSAFVNNGSIPKKYTCDGKNVNPPLIIENIPDNTKSLAIVVDDPDAPINTWVHWLVWNVQPTEKIMEGCVPGNEGINDFRQHNYGGPCPPSGTHRYFFRVYALDVKLNLGAGANRHELEAAMKNHVLGYGHLVGLYSRKSLVIF